MHGDHAGLQVEGKSMNKALRFVRWFTFTQESTADHWHILKLSILMPFELFFVKPICREGLNEEKIEKGSPINMVYEKIKYKTLQGRILTN